MFSEKNELKYYTNRIKKLKGGVEMEEKRTNIDMIRTVLKEHYDRYLSPLPFPKALELALQEKGNVPCEVQIPPYSKFLTCDEFCSYVGKMPVIYKKVSDERKVQKNVMENLPKDFGKFYIEEDSMFFPEADITIYTHLPFVDDGMHTHDHFELNYIYRGTGCFYFEQQKIMLKEGDFMIISPNSPHNVRGVDDDFIISIMVRKSTFKNVFWSLLSKDTVLSIFLRNSLDQNNKRNYMLFHTGVDIILCHHIQILMARSREKDIFVNHDMVCTLSQIFSTLLRKYSENISFYQVQDISSGHFNMNLLTQYIRQHYDTVTLKEVAEKFHYSESFFSRLIKQKFGKSFSELVREIRLSHAKDLLLYSNYTLREICDIVGYHSVSAFSRSYKEKYGVAPGTSREYSGSE